jgi:hypothetical protein
LEQEKTKREQSRIEQHSHQGAIEMASTERMKRLASTVERNDLEKSIKKPIKFAGSVSNKDKPKDLVKDTKEDQVVAEITRRETNRGQLVTMLPEIPKSYIGRQSMNKVK